MVPVRAAMSWRSARVEDLVALGGVQLGVGSELVSGFG